MGASTESQLRIDLNGYIWHTVWQMSSVVDHQVIRDDDGLKTLLFPLLVPVAILCFTYFITDVGALEGEILQGRLKNSHVKNTLLDIAFQPCLRLFKRLEPSLSCHRSQNVTGVNRIGRNGKFYFEISHKDVNF